MRSVRYCSRCGRRSLRTCGARSWDSPCAVCGGTMRTTTLLRGRPPSDGVGKPCRLTISLSAQDMLKLSRIAGRAGVSPAAWIQDLATTTIRVHR